MNDPLKEIADKLDSCEPRKISEVPESAKKALSQGLSPEQIMEEGLLEGLRRVGMKFKTGEVFIPEVLVAARAVHGSMDILKPSMKKGELKQRGRVLLGTVKGDLHDIGKNLVGIMLEASGYEIIDMGVNVPAERFIESVKENRADVLGLSALLTTTMNEMKTVLDLLKSEGVQTKVIVGGAPITQEFADRIGADAYGVNAGEAVEKVAALLKR